jgi:hypothetical protein
MDPVQISRAFIAEHAARFVDALEITKNEFNRWTPMLNTRMLSRGCSNGTRSIASTCSAPISANC